MQSVTLFRNQAVKTVDSIVYVTNVNWVIHSLWIRSSLNYTFVLFILSLVTIPSFYIIIYAHFLLLKFLF